MNIMTRFREFLIRYGFIAVPIHSEAALISLLFARHSLSDRWRGDQDSGKLEILRALEVAQGQLEHVVFDSDPKNAERIDKELSAISKCTLHGFFNPKYSVECRENCEWEAAIYSRIYEGKIHP